MTLFKNKIYQLFFLITIIFFSNNSYAFDDNYPKNPKVNALNYVFNIELSDKSD